MQAQPQMDPREVITLESFAIDPTLLGLPLARPLRRAGAMLVDLLIVVLLVHAGGLLFGLTAAWLFWRISGPSSARGILRRSWRFTFRSLAALVLFVLVVSSWGFWRDWGGDRFSAAQGASLAGELPPPSGRTASFAPESPPTATNPSGPAADPDGGVSIESLDEARTGSDTIAFLAGRIANLELDNRRLHESAIRLEQERGLIPLIRTVADELGLGFGWSGLYFTAFLVLWSGQTPGKRLLRMRVVRLDGKPMTWWCSFERFGGYAACIFTGLLGFVQMVWDRNRQGMHDKITETVVVRI